jgi:hypothetical protein
MVSVAVLSAVPEPAQFENLGLMRGFFKVAMRDFARKPQLNLPGSNVGRYPP